MGVYWLGRVRVLPMKERAQTGLGKLAPYIPVGPCVLPPPKKVSLAQALGRMHQNKVPLGPPYWRPTPLRQRGVRQYSGLSGRER